MDLAAQHSKHGIQLATTVAAALQGGPAVIHAAACVQVRVKQPSTDQQQAAVPFNCCALTVDTTHPITPTYHPPIHVAGVQECVRHPSADQWQAADNCWHHLS
jgi:hypothetical protein